MSLRVSSLFAVAEAESMMGRHCQKEPYTHCHEVNTLFVCGKEGGDKKRGLKGRGIREMYYGHTLYMPHHSDTSTVLLDMVLLEIRRK